MSSKTKSGKGTAENPIEIKAVDPNAGLLDILDSPMYRIKAASIKDMYCNYTYEILHGIGKGDKHVVKGSGIIMDSLQNAFRGLNAHLACIDGCFQHAQKPAEAFDEILSYPELIGNYEVTGFVISGGEGDEKVILSGHKSVIGSGGPVTLATSSVNIPETVIYKWTPELSEALELVRAEVLQYMHGNCTYPSDMPEDDPSQLKMFDNSDKNEDIDDELEKSRVS